MDRQEIKQQLIEILTSETYMAVPPESTAIHDDTSLIHDLGLESIRILNLIVDIEIRFGITVETEGSMLELFDKFSNLVDLVEAKVNGSLSG